MGNEGTTMLDAVEHARIIADMQRVCVVAGLQSRFLYESMKDYCGDGEVDWVKNFRKHKAEGLPGLVLEGVAHPDTRCQAICAALVRNYIDARVIPLNTVLDLLDEREMPAPTVLLIPNVFLQGKGKSLPMWKIQIIYDLLLSRSVQNKPSVVYVEEFPGLLSAYGQPFADFLSGFRIIKK